MDSSSLDKLIVWKHNLQEVKAFRPLKPPYNTVGECASWKPEVQLLFDALSDVIEVLTEDKK